MSQYFFIQNKSYFFYSEAIPQILFQASSKRCSWNLFSHTIKQNCLVILEVQYSSVFRNFSCVILELPSISYEIRNFSCGFETGCSTFPRIISYGFDQPKLFGDFSDAVSSKGGSLIYVTFYQTSLFLIQILVLRIWLDSYMQDHQVV